MTTPANTPEGKKYDIQDAHKLKVFMQEISTISSKYGRYIDLEDVPEKLKYAIEFISEMVEKGV